MGGARTALFNWLYARHHGGTFVLRVEDTDAKRSSLESVQAIIDSMHWLGLDWDEGPDKPGGGGPFGPYFQSERQALYAEAARKLEESGLAYRCYCTDAEMAARREEQQRRGEPVRYDGACKTRTEADKQRRVAEGVQPALRFGIATEVVTVPDAVKGDVAFDAALYGDLVIVRGGGQAMYNFACVVDDHLMQISHVIRGDEHLANTPKQMLLYRALGWDQPIFAHLSMILGKDREKLSKRHGHTSVGEYQAQGYLPDGMINYLALLGWSAQHGGASRASGAGEGSAAASTEGARPASSGGPAHGTSAGMRPSGSASSGGMSSGSTGAGGAPATGSGPKPSGTGGPHGQAGAEASDEIFSRAELVKRFDLDRVVRNPAVFDGNKLNWLDQQHIKRLAPDALERQVAPFLQQAFGRVHPHGESGSPAAFSAMVALIRDTLVVLSDVAKEAAVFYAPFAVDPEALAQVKARPSAPALVAALIEELGAAGELSRETCKAALARAGQKAGAKGKDLFHTARVALTGQAHGHDLSGCLAIMGREKVLANLRAAAEKINERP